MRHPALLLALLLTLLAPDALAQRFSPSPARYGVGFDVTGAIPGQDLIPKGIAIGLRGRAALPINADVSLAGDVGLAAHLWDGRDQTRWVLNPQTSLIVTLPSSPDRRNTRYVLGGFGAYLPFSGGSGGPTVHLGIGQAIPLNDTSVYMEFDPSLLVGDGETTVVIAARAGVIF
jgi:hypothetical protein